MPIYEYACRSCAHEFEALVLKTTVPVCPECESVDLERLLSRSVVRSESTKQMASRAARQRDARQAAERTHAQHEYERNHDR